MTGCKGDGDKTLIKELEQSSNKRAGVKCCIAIESLTKFKWDKVYVFPDWSISDTISKAIGFHYSGSDVQDDYSRILFTYNKEVVYEEDFKSLNYGNSSIDFSDMTDNVSKSKYINFTPTTAVFSIQILKPNDCQGCLIYKLKSNK